VAEFGFGMGGDVGLDLLPIALVVPYAFTRGANRQHTAEGFDFCQGFLQIRNKLFPLGFGALARRYIAADALVNDATIGLPTLG